MKLMITCMLLNIIYVTSTAQNLTGRIHYDAVVDFSKEEAELKDPTIPIDRKRKLEASIKSRRKLLERSYILDFNKDESVYSENKKIGITDADSPLASSRGDYYKSFRENIYISGVHVFGKTFLQSDTLRKFNWKLHPETKTIGKYTCNKATFSEERDAQQFIKKEDGSFDQKIVRKLVTTTAWYCPQIPIMNGPREYGGLPGLILQLGDDFYPDFPLTVYCTEITLDPKGGVKVKRPAGKKLYTEAELKKEVQRQMGIS